MVALLNRINDLIPLIDSWSLSLDDVRNVDVMYCLGMLQKTFLEPGALPQAAFFNPFRVFLQPA